MTEPDVNAYHPFLPSLPDNRFEMSHGNGWEYKFLFQDGIYKKECVKCMFLTQQKNPTNYTLVCHQTDQASIKHKTHTHIHTTKSIIKALTINKNLYLPARSRLNRQGCRCPPTSLSAQHSTWSFFCKCDWRSDEWKACKRRELCKSSRVPIELMGKLFSPSGLLTSQWNRTWALGTESTWQKMGGSRWSLAPTAITCGCWALHTGGSVDRGKEREEEEEEKN